MRFVSQQPVASVLNHCVVCALTTHSGYAVAWLADTYHLCACGTDKAYPDKLGFAAPAREDSEADSSQADDESVSRTDWSNCEGDPSLCTLGFERKIPDCDGCSNDAFTLPENVFADPTRGPQLGEQPAECYEQDTAALNASCPRPTDLHELFDAVAQATDAGDQVKAKAELAAVLNVTSYMVWQLVTNFLDEGDHGWHNYYLYRPDFGQPWQVIN